MGMPAYLQPDLEADLVLPSTPGGRVNYQDRTAFLFLFFPSLLLVLRSWLRGGCLSALSVQRYQAWLLILYTGLALRENILRVNGSDIRPWWIKHHYFAMAMALISLTWETQKQRGVQLFLQWAIMQGVAMLLQNRYQRQRLCTHIALGKARRMDVVWGETAGVDGQLWLLAPILFILQCVYTMGDVYPNSTKLSKGEYNLQLYLRHDNVQYLEKMKQLVLFIERNLEDKEIIRLSFYSQPDGPVMGNGSFKSSVLVPGVKEAFYVGPPTKDKLPKNSPEGSVLLGVISYGKLSFGVQEKGKNPQKNPVSYQIYYQVPPIKFDEDKGKGCSAACTKSVSERLEEEVRDAKIKVLASLKQGTAEECLEWKKLSSSLKSEYPKYTPLLAKILEGLLSQNNVEDKIPHLEEIIDAADEVIGSVDTEELAKYFSFKSDPEDEGAEKMKKKMETARDQLAEALYQKGLAMAEIESMKGEEALVLASTEGANVLDRTNDKSVPESNTLPDLFEENVKELKKWVDVKSSKYATLLVIRERRCGRLGTALKALNDMIQVDGEAL